jgi:hypothetical protein
MWRYRTALLVLLLPVPAALAGVTVEQALEVAQKRSGAPLDPSPVYDTSAPDPDHVGFATAPDRRPRRLYRVSLVTGAYLGYHEESDSPPPGGVTQQQALERAKRAAAESLPECVPQMEWAVDERETSYEIRGTLTSPPGAPRGPTTNCRVVVNRSTGRMTYHQQLHDVPQPVTRAIDADGAIESARRALGDPAAVPLKTPYLWEDPAGPGWHLKMGVSGGRCAGVYVDAHTGEVTFVGWHVGAAEPARAASAERAFPWLPAGGGAAAVVVLAAAVLVVRRRPHP